MLQTQNRKKAIMFMLLQALCFSSMNIIIKYTGTLPLAAKVCIRYMPTVVVIPIIKLAQHKTLKFKQGCLKYHIARSAFCTIGTFSSFYAVAHMVLSDASMLMQMCPFFTILISAIFLHERPNFKQILLILIALGGAVFVIKPTTDMFGNIAAFAALTYAFVVGCVYTVGRSLSLHGEDSLLVVFYHAVFSIIVSGLIWVIQKPEVQITLVEFLLMCLCGLIGMCGHFCVTNAYKYAPAPEISIFDISQVLMSAVFGLVFFKEIADVYSYIGYAIILAASLVMFFDDRKALRAALKK